MNLVISMFSENMFSISLVDFTRLKYNNLKEHKTLKNEFRKTSTSLDYDEAYNSELMI